MKYFLLLFITLYGINSFAQIGSATCFKTNDGKITPNKAITDATGNLYVTGVFERRVDFDPGPAVFELKTASDEDLFLLKLSPEGKFLWVKTLGGTYSDRAFDVNLDSEQNVYITGTINGTLDLDPGPSVINYTCKGSFDGFISKFNSNGEMQWVHPFGSADWDEGRSIAIDQNDNIYLAGNFTDSIDVDPSTNINYIKSKGNTDLFLLKLSKNGEFKWAHPFGGNTWENEEAAVTLDNNGDVLMTGSFAYKADFDPGAGEFFLDTRGSHQVFILKLDQDGNFIWVKNTQSYGDSFPYGIAVDTLNNIFVTGSYNFKIDFDPGAGEFIKVAEKDSDIFLLKLDSSGKFEWVEELSGNHYEYSYSIAVNNDQDLFITGLFRDSLNFYLNNQKTTFVSKGDDDLFIAKIKNEGGIEWVTHYGSRYSKDMGTSVHINPINENLIITAYLSGQKNLLENLETNLQEGDYFAGLIFNIDPSLLITKTLVSNNRDIEVNFFPNPATNHIWLKSGNTAPFEVKLIDNFGNTIINKTITTSTVKLELSEIPVGMYLLIIEQNNQEVTERVVKIE